MPTKDVKFWQTELELAGKHEQTWRRRARKVVKIYRDDHTGSNDSSGGSLDARFNILWSNTQTQRPALYSATPKPVVKRRHRQQGELGRQISIALERALIYSLDPGGSYDFDRVAEKLILDYLLPGRMVARVKYHPVLTSKVRIVETDDPENPDIIEEKGGKFLLEEKYDELVDEEVRIYHIPWDQYRQAVANVWDDVWWVAYGNNFLTLEEIQEQFGDEHTEVPMQHIAHLEDKDGEPADQSERTVKKAQVWEIWDRDDRLVYAIVEGYSKFLMEKEEDPLKLRAFYPSPEPINIVETPDSLIPIPEYTMYQYQAEELNAMTRRINNLVNAMKLAGLYPGSQKDIIKDLLNSKENTLVPVEDWGAITERGGLAGMIEWLPLRDVADAWQRLMVHRQTLIQDIFDLTGISDIQRGSTDPRETKGAQQIKASFGSRRLLPKQQDTQRFFRDLFRLQAEIIAEHFETDTIAKMAQMPVEELKPVRDVMRDDALRSFTIDIETDSTIAVDEEREKQGVAEFVAAMGSFLGQIFPIVQAQPKSVVPLGKMMLWMSRKFRIARDVEDEIEDFLNEFAQISNEPQGKDPAAQAAQAEAQQAQAEMAMKAQAIQVDQKIKAAQSQADTQRKDRESLAANQRAERKAALDEKIARLEIAEREEKIRLMREEAQAKVLLSAVDQRTKSLQQDSKGEDKSSSSTVVVTSEPKAKRIDLIKDDEGKLKGAEITPIEEKQTIKFERGEDDKISSAEIT